MKISSQKLALAGFLGLLGGATLFFILPSVQKPTQPPAGQTAVEIDWFLLRKWDASGQNPIPDTLKPFHGAWIKLPGFMIPLEDNQAQASEFLLVPSPMSCIHVPPPPPNQTVHVRMATGRKANVSFGPVWVQGKLRLTESSGVYGKSMYQMIGESVEEYQ
jgi:uncharacterized protein